MFELAEDPKEVAGNVIWYVAGDFIILIFEFEILGYYRKYFERIAAGSGYPVIFLKFPQKSVVEIFVFFDCYDFYGRRGYQEVRQFAMAGTDFDHGFVRGNFQ